jgi:parallel beta-helix repeat protein
MRQMIFTLFLLVLGVPLADAGDAGFLDAIIRQNIAAGKKIISIPAGNYSVRGSIRLTDLDDVELVASPGTTVVASQNAPVFLVAKSSRIRIKGFTIRSVDPRNPQSPVAFGFSSGKDLASSENATTTGIKIVDSSAIIVSDCTVKGFYRGIYITSSNAVTRDITVKNCVVTDCGYLSITAYKVLKPKQEQPLVNITIKDNEVRSSEMGPTFIGVKNGTISGNKVTRNIIGIRIEQSDNNLIFENTVSENLKMGIWVYNHSSYNTISKNVIANNNLQAEKIKKIARKHKLDENYLPGDLVCSDVAPEKLKHYGPTARSHPVLAYNPEFWPYPTAYEHITPGNKFGTVDEESYKKYWGIYFCQWSGVGIELRNAASYNQLRDNRIYNTAPATPSTGYMFYGIRISQLGLMKDKDAYASRGNVIRNNIIKNMVKGDILDDNKRFKVNIKNEY